MFFEAIDTLLKKPLSPHADDFAPRAQMHSNLTVAQSFCGEQYHLCAQDDKIRQRIFPCSAQQLVLLR